MNDIYRVLPHRDIDVRSAYAGAPQRYRHRPCGMDLTERQIKDDNWCHHCAKIINMAAARRARAEWK